MNSYLHSSDTLLLMHNENAKKQTKIKILLIDSMIHKYIQS